MGYNKDGSYRVNIYLNPQIEKEKTLIDYLESKFSPKDHIKDMLYTLAQGQQPIIITTDKPQIIQQEQQEEYEEIKGLGDIEL